MTKNTNYRKGAAREYNIMKHLKKEFDIVIRSAGSHSPVDIIAIDTKNLRINFIQSKPPSMSNKAKDRIEESLELLNNEYICKVFCISSPKELENHPNKSAALTKTNVNDNNWIPENIDNSGNLICLKCGNYTNELNKEELCQNCFYSELEGNKLDQIQLNQPKEAVS